jgi:hypothetical protein
MLIMALALSILALLATFYQAYLQRIHNEKSVKPLIQINLTDSNGLIFVHIQNNGLGPVIVQKLVFIKDEQLYNDIKDCLALNPNSYQHVSINKSVTKVVPPGTYLEVFSKQFDTTNALAEMDKIRRELATIKLKVEGKDIYDNKVIVERELSWFVRHEK